MKHFLLSIVFVSAGVFASANPFDLKENLQKIDQDQDILLSALKEMADKKEVDVEEEPVSASRNTVENSARAEQSVAENNEMTEAKRAEEYRRMEEERLSVIEEEKDKIDQVREKEAENLSAKKRETERLEVEAYEAKRRAKKEQDEARTKARMAEKKAKEVKAAKLKAKHAIVDIDIEREERMSKKEADKEYLEAIREMH